MSPAATHRRHSTALVSTASQLDKRAIPPAEWAGVDALVLVVERAKWVIDGAFLPDARALYTLYCSSAHMHSFTHALLAAANAHNAPLSDNTVIALQDHINRH